MKQALADKALLAFQEAAFLPDRWQTALAGLADVAGSNLAFGQMVGDGGYRTIISDGIGVEMQTRYLADGWIDMNICRERGLALTNRGFRGLITERDMLSEAEQASHPFQQDFLRHYGASHEAGIVLARHEGSSFILTLHRDLSKGAYTPDELGFMSELIRRLVNAASLALRTKLDHAIETTDMLAGRAGAVALLTQNGVSLFHSPAFERHIGDAIRLREGRVSAVEAESDRRLQGAIASASAWTVGRPTVPAPVVLRRRTGPPVVARLHPVAGAARDFLGLAKTILTLDDLAEGARSPAPGLLADAFGLTPAEARLACRLALSATLREAAAAERITYESARTRLKTIFDKTGVGNQSALAVLVSRLA